MFLYDKVNDIYHLLGADSGCRCGMPCDGFYICLVADESHKGKECEECKKIPTTIEMEFAMRDILENL